MVKREGAGNGMRMEGGLFEEFIREKRQRAIGEGGEERKKVGDGGEGKREECRHNGMKWRADAEV